MRPDAGKGLISGSHVTTQPHVGTHPLHHARAATLTPSVHSIIIPLWHALQLAPILQDAARQRQLP